MSSARSPYVFCEPFAGSAALTYWLLGGKPPISYMGGKSGYAHVIADILGLSRRNRPRGIILGEPGPFAAVHATLGGASGVAEEVAGWMTCSNRAFRGGDPETGYKDYEAYAQRGTRDEPAEMTEALAARIEETAGFLHANALSMVKNGEAAGYSRVNGEGNDFTDRHGASGHWHATTPEVSAQRVEDAAAWLTCAGQSFRIGHPDSGYNKTEAEGSQISDTHGATRPWMDRIMPTIPDLPMPAAHAVAKIIRSWKDEEPRALWERLKAKGWPSLLLPEGCRGRWLGPQSVEEVAGWLTVRARSFNSGARDGYCPPNAPAPACEIRDGKHGWNSEGNPVHNYYSPDHPAPAVESLPTFPALAVWQGFAEDLPLPMSLSGVVIYMDVPYQGTTKYKYGDCPRETVLRLARDWSARGAIVAISEAVPLDAELGEGWHRVRIDHARRGQKRTFSKQQEEWVTLNRPPCHVPAKQSGLALELQEVAREKPAVDRPKPAPSEPEREQLTLFGGAK